MIYWILKHLIIGPLLKTVYRPWVEGAENLPASGPVIIVGNHLSVIDSFFMPLMVDRRVSFLAKSDYFTGKGLKGWFVKTFMLSIGQIPIDRSGGKASEASLNTGLAVLDRELVAAMAEIQTTGRLESRPAALRPMTRTDAALSEPLLARFLAETALAPGYAPRGKIASLRLARQLISARVLRVQEFALELGEGKRQGHLAILVPQAEPEPPEPERRDAVLPSWPRRYAASPGAPPAPPKTLRT